MSPVIVRADAFRFSVPVKSPFRIATMTAHEAPNVLVRIEDSDGRIGWGEASLLVSILGETQATVLGAAEFLASLLVGRESLAYRDSIHLMDRSMPGQNAAVSAFEMALLDLAGKTLGVPAYRLLGGSARPLETDMTIAIVSPSIAAEEAKAHWSNGIKHLKIKLGGGDDVARVAAVREACPTAGIRVDANQGWEREEALAALNHLAEYDVQFCEQPLRKSDLAGMAWLHQWSPVPVMADESIFDMADAAQLCEENACARFNLKLCKTRGILTAVEIAEYLHRRGLTCMMGGMMESRLGVTASAHAALCSPAFRWFDLDANHSHAEETMRGGFELIDGCLHLSDAPGFGCEPLVDPLQ